MKKVLAIAGIATLVAVMGIVAAGTVALAQEPPWKSPSSSKMLFHSPFGGEQRGGFCSGLLGISVEQAQAYRQQMVVSFAEALGMTTDELKATLAKGETPCGIAEAYGLDAVEVWEATESARQDILQQAVEDGLLTQRQADWISERMADHNPGEWCDDDGPPAFFGSRRGRGPDRLLGHRPFGMMGTGFEEAQVYWEGIGDAFAEALGMSVEELEVAIAEGQTACEIIEAQGLDPAEVWEVTEDTHQELLQQAVADELLTQGQADWISQRMGEHNPGDLCDEDDLGHDGWELRPGFSGHSFRPEDFDPESQGWPQRSRLRGSFVMPGQ